MRSRFCSKVSSTRCPDSTRHSEIDPFGGFHVWFKKCQWQSSRSVAVISVLNSGFECIFVYTNVTPTRGDPEHSSILFQCHRHIAYTLRACGILVNFLNELISSFDIGINCNTYLCRALRI